MTDVIDRVQANGDIIMSADGLYYFWPTKNNGMYSAEDLVAISNELTRRNEKLITTADVGC